LLAVSVGLVRACRRAGSQDREKTFTSIQFLMRKSTVGRLRGWILASATTVKVTKPGWSTVRLSNSGQQHCVNGPERDQDCSEMQHTGHKNIKFVSVVSRTSSYNDAEQSTTATSISVSWTSLDKRSFGRLKTQQEAM